LSNQKLVEKGTSDLLKKQLVEKIPISPIFAQNIDVSINLIIFVSFLGKVCPKSCIFSKRHHSSFYGCTIKNWCTSLVEISQNVTIQFTTTCDL
jgi:hypothetical protein